jgi:hypothetical protein
MSSDEDVPAPSPLASVVARRASREAKSMREESNSDEDTSSNEECGIRPGSEKTPPVSISYLYLSRGAVGRIGGGGG